MNENPETLKHLTRQVFVVCTLCEGVGFVLFDEPDGLVREKCEMCGGIGEIDPLR
jgi:hypothetical protein